MKITIDGPAGSGKSTVAREVSRRLCIPYLNTGLVYRAFAYVSMLEDLQDIFEVFQRPLYIRPEVAQTQVIYKEEAIQNQLSSEEVGRRASQIATIPAFRERINKFFRELLGEGPAVVEGRDAGTHIFPDAELKIFLTASAEERARRRCLQLEAQGLQANYEEILKAIVERDQRDANRPLYPFRPAEDAIIIDTTHMSIEEVVKKVLTLLEEAKK